MYKQDKTTCAAIMEEILTIFFFVCYFIIGVFLLIESIRSFIAKQKRAGYEFLAFFCIWLISFAIPVIRKFLA